MSISAMKCALQSLESVEKVNGWNKDSIVGRHCTQSAHFLRQAIEQAEDAVAAEREACAQLLENGRFLHDEAPAAILAKEAAKAIRARGDASDTSQEPVDETAKDRHEPDEDIYDIWVETPCKTHPDAPHGFDRNASHSADRYVCECEGWDPQPEPPPECQTEEEKTAFAFGWWKAMETKRQWVGLTDEEIKDIREDLTYDDEDFNELEFARDIEAKLKEKNGG